MAGVWVRVLSYRVWGPMPGAMKLKLVNQLSVHAENIATAFSKKMI